MSYSAATGSSQVPLEAETAIRQVNDATVHDAHQQIADAREIRPRARFESPGDTISITNGQIKYG